MYPDLDCRALVETVTDYLEGTMPARERARFEGHLLTCLGFGCANYVEQMRETIRVAGRLRDDGLPSGLREGLLVAFRGSQKP